MGAHLSNATSTAKKDLHTVWFLGRTKYLVGRTNEWVANPLGPGQTSALQKLLAYPFCYKQ